MKIQLAIHHHRIDESVAEEAHAVWLLTNADLCSTARMRTFMQFIANRIISMRPLFEGRYSSRPGKPDPRPFSEHDVIAND